MIYERRDLFFLFLAGLWGFAGVMLLAAGSHADATGRLTSAGMMLLFHACAGIGLIHSGFMGPRMRFNVLLLLMIGSGVFAADLCSRVLRGESLLPNLAPTGGVLVMLGWLGIAVSAGLQFAAKPKA